jgi:5-methyltetrahydropteroyltriglutamate--homocysteine methyltransferase
VESPEEIAQSIRAALREIPAEKVFLNPDCGFATFSLRPMNQRELAKRKLQSLVDAADRVRSELADRVTL